MRRKGLTILLLFKIASIILLILLIAGIGKKQDHPREAMFYKKLDEDNKVWCQLCPRRCVIAEGKTGFCRVRKNIGGRLYSLVYARPCTVTIEPIEKAPFYHFIPGHMRLCLATVSCNLRCKYCQNWHISQVGPGDVREFNLSPAEVVKKAERAGVKSICFTFTEPVVSYEYIYDTARIARERGIKTSIVSAGFINQEPMKELLRVLDAVKIDLKAFDERFYEDICSAELKPVLETLKVIKEQGMVHLEIVNLVLPTLNDKPTKIKKMCEWIKEDLGDEVPVHFTRFFPAYRLTQLPATPIETLEEAVRIARVTGLKYVYIGNVPGHEYNNTFCPSCGKMLIERTGFTILKNDAKDGRCKSCGHKIPGIWR